MLGLSWTEASNEEGDIVLMLLMELADMGTLAAFQSQKKSLPYGLKMKLCRDIANGLQALHACGIVHGDVKSENVLVFTDGNGLPVAKLNDFGTASVLGIAPDTQSEEDPEYQLSAATRLWMAPEAAGPIKRSELHLTDVYSFGLLAWRVLIDGANPFEDFDLPRGTDARSAKIESIKREFSATHVGIIVGKIKQALMLELSSVEQSGLMWLFLLTIACPPEERNLSRALNRGRHEDVYFDILETSIVSIFHVTLDNLVFDVKQHPDCLRTRKLAIELQSQLVSAYRETLKAAATISLREPIHPRIQSYIIQCSWVLIVFQFGLVGIWNGGFAEDLTPLVWTVSQIGKGPQKQTALSMLFSLAEMCSSLSASPTFPEIIDAGVQAAMEGVPSALYFLRRYHRSAQRGLGYFSMGGNAEKLSNSSVEALYRLGNLAEALANARWKTPLGLKTGGVPNEPSVAEACSGMKDLLTNEVLPARSTDADEESALLMSCRRGERDNMTALLQTGCDATKLSSIGESCLHWLHAFGEADIGEMSERLYDQGADLLAVAVDSSIVSRLESSCHSQLGLIYRDIPMCRAVTLGSLIAVQALTSIFRRHNLDVSAKFSILYEVSVLAASLHLSGILRHLILEIEFQCKDFPGIRWRIMD
ncbi:MAG: hypothetical protein M1840_002131 [Geoglossum simile]|nr:MAG: hypothetical protein M1840_002131 [Geoglossum simile]